MPAECCPGATRRCLRMLPRRHAGGACRARPGASPGTAGAGTASADTGAAGAPGGSRPQPRRPTGLSSICPRPSATRPSPSPAGCRQPVRARVVTAVMLCFEKQGGSPVVEANTYLYYIQLRGSLPSPNKWVPYDDSREQIGDRRLQAAVGDQLPRRPRRSRSATCASPNGVIGKVVVYNMEERQRVKIVDYVGSKKVEQSKIEEELKKKASPIRLDSFIDPGLIREGERRRPRHVRREGLPVRRGQAGDQAGRGRPEAGERDLPHHRRAEGQDPQGRLRRQQRDQATASSSAG